MFCTKVCFAISCLSTICLFTSAGFAQDFYQPQVTYSSSFNSYPAYADQYVPEQLSDATIVGAPIQSYDSYGVQTESYGGVQGGFVQGTVIQGAVVQGSPVVMPHIISKDYGYKGPGDMRTHLWNDHGDELKTNGVSKAQLEAMSMATVQKWHNFFHGTEGKPAQ